MSRAGASHQAAGLAQQSDQSACQNSPVASKAGATSTTRKLYFEERSDNAKSGKDGHPNCAGADNHVTWLSEKEKPAQHVEKIAKQIEDAPHRELTDTPDFDAEPSLDDNKQIGIDIKVDLQKFAATATDADTVPNEHRLVRESTGR